MNFKEFQQQIIDSCHEAGACTDEFKRLRITLDLNDPTAFVRVLLGNHGWCIENGIYGATSMLQLEEQDILLRAGLRTQLNVPIDFQPERVAGRLWKPFNEGATNENWEGDYMTFDQANDPDAGRIMPSNNDFIALSTQKREWSIYQNQFGYLFDGRLFIPAGGFRYKDAGALAYVGNNGFSWSSTVGGTNAFYLYFGSANLNPSSANYRGHGFQVRCLQE